MYFDRNAIHFHSMWPDFCYCCHSRSRALYCIHNTPCIQHSSYDAYFSSFCFSLLWIIVTIQHTRHQFDSIETFKEGGSGIKVVFSIVHVKCCNRQHRTVLVTSLSTSFVYMCVWVNFFSHPSGQKTPEKIQNHNRSSTMQLNTSNNKVNDEMLVCISSLLAFKLRWSSKRERDK